MRAIALAGPGSAASLLDLPAPVAGGGEVFVRVTHSWSNGFDVAVAAGHLAGMTEHVYPARERIRP